MIETVVKQNTQGLSASYKMFTVDNCVWGSAEIPFNAIGGKISCVIPENTQVLMEYQRKSGIRYYELQLFGKSIGYIKQVWRKGSLFKPGFEYHRVFWEGKEYNIYPIGMGKEGIYYPCYERDNNGNELQQVGLIHKPGIVHDLKDQYTCFAEKKEVMNFLMLYVIYTDIWDYRDTGEMAIKSTKAKYVVSRNKELLSKYTPNYLKKSHSG